MKKKIVLAVTGASGAIYAKLLLTKIKKLSGRISNIGIVMTENAKEVWRHELGNRDYEKFSFTFYGKSDFHAPFASGSAGYDTMIICPCSMGTLGRIASGTSDDLIIRAADVMLKERKKLILVLRETPFNLIHIRNMQQVTEAGGIICPAIPSFYSKPKTIEEAALTVIDRVLILAGFDLETFRWGKGLEAGK
ncbi:MAG: UbiX family flavin prenyltransferase [Bacteroidetes bacterium]|nr:UbiX family flavin prenyltransferase [Bacteroidota bacterium]